MLTLNLWNRDEASETRNQRVGRFLNDERPDLVALQEVSDLSAPLLVGAERLGYQCHFAYSHQGNGRDEGLAVLTLCRSRISKVVELTAARNDMRRIVQVVELSQPVAGHPIAFLNTHLAHLPNGSRTARCKPKTCLESLRRCGQVRPASPSSWWSAVTSTTSLTAQPC